MVDALNAQDGIGDALFVALDHVISQTEPILLKFSLNENVCEEQILQVIANLGQIVDVIQIIVEVARDTLLTH